MPGGENSLIQFTPETDDEEDGYAEIIRQGFADWFPDCEPQDLDGCAADIALALRLRREDGDAQESPPFIEHYVRRRRAEGSGQEERSRTSAGAGNSSVTEAAVIFTGEEWAQLFQTFARLMSVFSSNHEVAEAIRRENEIWALVLEKEDLRRAGIGDPPLVALEPEAW